MPIYEYQCTLCEHKMEAMQKMNDDPLKDCPACTMPGLQKLMSAASFRLSGSGWYETDFKTGDKRQLAESESGKAPAASEGGSADGEPSKKSANGDKTAAETHKATPGDKSSGKQDSKSSSKSTGKSDKGSK